MSDIPGQMLAVQGYEKPDLYSSEPTGGAPWSLDWRDVLPIAPDMIHNHTTPAYLGVFDGTEGVTDWNPWEGVTGPHPSARGTHNGPGQPGPIRFGYGSPMGLQEFATDAPLAIDSFDRSPDHAQVQLSGVSSIAALVPFIELPDYGQSIDPSAIAGFGTGVAPYHFDYGYQLDQSSAGAMGPRQVFRPPPTYSDQTAGVYAAGF